MAPIEKKANGADELISLVGATFACAPGVAQVIGKAARLCEYPARGTIVNYDDVTADVHLLTMGHARMIVHSVEGRMIVIEDYGVGDLFGVNGLFEASPSSSQVCTVTAARTGAIACHVFVGLMSVHADVALALSRMMVTRLAAANRRMSENSTLSAVGRVYAELLRRARATADLTISPVPVFADFALSVQTTRETVSRAINALEKRGIVRRGDGSLIVVAPHRLENLIY